MSIMVDTHINEVHGDLTIVARSKRPSNGYLHYYWCKCACGNLKRYRYDQLRKNKACGLCEDFTASDVNTKLRGMESEQR